VRVELAGGQAGRLAVEPGGDRLAVRGALHDGVVVSRGRLVPPPFGWSPEDGSPGRMGRVDDLERLAAAAVDGDPLAAAALVRATQSDVWRLCAALGDRQSADDLTQETYLRAFGSLHRFEGRSSLRTWLLSIARRVCADAVRSRRRRRLTLVREDAELEALGSGDDADRVGEGAAVADLLARLDPDRREAFVLTQLLGLPYAEAAEVAGCPVGTIRSRVARARADLVEALGDEAATARA
jgi:RNA polymerase sigma-70 factor, ECF subfamily